MKLKCDDGVVRTFHIAVCDGDPLGGGRYAEGYREAMCDHCGHPFGVHDTKVLKPLFRAHSCDEVRKQAMSED